MKDVTITIPAKTVRELLEHGPDVFDREKLFNRLTNELIIPAAFSTADPSPVQTPVNILIDMTARQVQRDATHTNFPAKDITVIGMIKAMRNVVPFVGHTIGRQLASAGVLDWSIERGAEMGLAQAKKFVDTHTVQIYGAIDRYSYTR